MLCKKCGAEYENAKFCPECGTPANEGFQANQPQPPAQQWQPPANQPQPKKKKKGCLIAFLVVAGILLVFIIIAVSGGGDDKEKTPAVNGNTVITTQTTKTPLVVTVDDLVDALEENALKASETYKGAYLELTGTLTNIDSSGKYFSIGILADDFSLTTVLCNIDKEHLETVMNFKSKQKVTVIGTVKNVGEVLGYTFQVETIK